MDATIYRKPGVVEILKGFSFNYKIFQYHERYTLIFSLVYLTFYISLPNFGYDFNKWDRSWGFYYFQRSFWFCWGQKTWSLRLPWDFEMVRHEVLFPDGSLRKPPGDSWDVADGRMVEKHPYTYTLKNGIEQNRTATVYTEEREWRWRWFKWLPWPRIIRRCIDVSFNDEVGERTGSWKGGVMGCGYDVLPGEKMGDTLRRMERERVFD